MDSRLPPGSKTPAGGTFWHRRSGPRHVVGNSVWTADQSFRRRHCNRSRSCRPCRGLAGSLFRRSGRSRHHAHRRHQLSFPAILIALILIAVLGQGTSKVIIALITVQWAYYARTVRSLRSSSARNTSRPRAVSHFVALRGSFPPSAAKLPAADDRRSDGAVAAAIRWRRHAFSASGCRSPSHRSSFSHRRLSIPLSGKYWISFFPGIALLLTIVSINLVADQLRDVLNPRLQK